MKKNDKKILISGILLSVFLILFGVSYAFFSFTAETNVNVFTTGVVKMNLSNGNDNILLTNAFPETREKAESKDNNYIDFTVTGTNTYNEPIYYEIDIMYGDIPSGYNNSDRIGDKYINVELIDLDLDSVLLVEKYENLDNKRIYVRTIETTNVQVEHNYRLRIWIDDSVLISDTDENKTFCASSECNDLTKQIYEELFGSLKVKVYGDFEEKYVETPVRCFSTYSETETTIGLSGLNPSCNSSTLVYPSIVNGKTVTKINGVNGKTFVETVIIPDTVVDIDDGAFYECVNLKKIVLPAHLTRIGASSFSKCTKLEKIDIPDTVTSIGTSAFLGCTNLKDAKLPNSLTTIGVSAFMNSGITSVEIPPHLTFISYSAFNNCDGLTELVIPNTVTGIDQAAFCDCSNLETVTIPESVTTLNPGSFAYCSKLTTLNIAYTTRIYFQNAFQTSNTIKYLNILSPTTRVYESAFSGWTNLERITLPEGLTTIDELGFAGESNLKEINLPSTLTSIGNVAFASATSLEHIDVYFTNPSNVSLYMNGSNPFNNIDLSSVQLRLSNYSNKTLFENDPYWGLFSIRDINGNQ